MSMLEVSTLEKIRYGYKPKLPGCFAGEITDFSINLGAATEPAVDQEDLKGIFKHTYGKPHVQFAKGKNDKTARQLAVGVILSGGQAAGGHNVVSGLFDALKKGNANSKLFGFLGGPGGLIDCKYIEITAPLVDRYRNTGGFDIIGSGRTKIEKPEQFAASLESAKKLALNAIVIIGGDDSNTTAALLAEYFVEHGSDIQVIGCPKTIDGDLKNEYIETSFGFDTAVKTYSEVIGNICRDSNSAKKYWHFIKLMGRAGSHITLECALQTHPNVCLISEEVEEKKKSVQEIVEEVCDSVVKRAEKKENFGVVLIPEGLIEFIPEMKILIQEINDIMAHHAEEFAKQEQGVKGQRMWMESKLSPPNSKLLSSLPKEIAYQLLLDRDPHGNVVVSQIDTEKLIMIMVADRLAQLKKEGKYTGTFASQPHFFGYEGRSAYPSNFDADYCYSLGFSAFALIAGGFTGYLASVKNLTAPAAEWEAGGLPLVMMMNMEQRHGKKKAVIKKALVDLKGGPYQFFLSHRAQWALSTSFLVPGAIQYFGPPELCDAPTITLLLEQEERLKKKK